jgi:hypothetical protein
MDETSLTLGWLVGRRIAGQRRKPVTYLYNGVELPPLPEWDKETYPYAWIRTVNGRYFFAATSSRPYYVWDNDNGIGIVSAYGKYVRYNLVDGVWVLDAEDLGSTGFGLKEGASMFVWTNFDVITEDGTVYFSACTSTDPNVPPEPADPAHPCPDKSINYLYGGVELPALPDYDPKVYPYACVCKSYGMGGGYYGFSVSRSAFYQDSIIAENAARAVNPGFYWLINDDGSEDAWRDKHEGAAPFDAVQDILWSNHDIINIEDNSMLHTASDPIPVYA